MNKRIFIIIVAVAILSALSIARADLTLWYLDGTILKPVDSTWTIDVTIPTDTDWRMSGDMLIATGTAHAAGIGDTTPPFTLTVKTATTSGYFGITNSADGDVFIVNGSGNLGIGTTTPSEMLTVWGGAYFGTSTTPTLYVASSTGRVGIATSSPAYTLDVNGQLRVRATSTFAGNVGIGTTTPSGALQVAGDEVRIGDAGTPTYVTGDGDLFVERILEVGSVSTEGTIRLMGGGTLYTGSIALGRSDITSVFGIYAYTDDSLSLYARGDQTTEGLSVYTKNAAGADTLRMYISNLADTANLSFQNSNVGIGTSTPAYTLDIEGTLGVSGTTTLSNASTTNLSITGLQTGFLKIDASGNVSTSSIDISTDTNLAAGRSLTMSGDSMELDAEIYQKTLSFNVGTSTKEVVSKNRNALTLTKAYCYTTAGTSTMNIIERTLSNLTSTTTLLTASLNCLSSNQTIASTTSFSDSAIAVDSLIVATTSSATSTASGGVYLFLDYNVDD